MDGWDFNLIFFFFFENRMVGIEFERKWQCSSNHDWQLVQFLSYEGLEFFFFFG